MKVKPQNGHAVILKLLRQQKRSRWFIREYLGIMKGQVSGRAILAATPDKPCTLPRPMVRKYLAAVADVVIAKEQQRANEMKPVTTVWRKP